MINSDRPYNNVWETLICDASLDKPCKILRYSLGLTEAEVYVYKSQSDGKKHLKISTDIYCLETGEIIKNSRYSFIGDVEGEISEIVARVKAIADVLNRHNYQCYFKIYDDNLEFINEYPKSE